MEAQIGNSGSQSLYAFLTKMAFSDILWDFIKKKVLATILLWLTAGKSYLRGKHLCSVFISRKTMSQSKMIHTNHLKSKLGIFRKAILSLKAQEGSPNIKFMIGLSTSASTRERKLKLAI